MTWIRTKPPKQDAEVARAMREGMKDYPGEYAPERRGERNLPPIVADDSIVLSHSLIPAALQHIFAAFGALMSPELPLVRREHELIAATVSALNRCFY